MIAFLAKADVALSVTMTCCSTLLSPFVTPLAMKVLAGCFVEIDATKMMFEILKVVIVPMLAGGIVHRILRRQFDKHKAICDKALSVLSMVGICYTILALTAPSRDTFASAGVLIIFSAIVHNTVGYASATMVSTRRKGLRFSSGKSLSHFLGRLQGQTLLPHGRKD